MSRRVAICLGLLVGLGPDLFAATWPNLRDALSAKDSLAADDWAEVMRAYGREDVRDEVRRTMEGLDALPRVELAAMLEHADLAVRLGALDWLETGTQDDFGFDPWRVPGHPDNGEALAKWKAWAEDAEVEEKPRTLSLSDADAQAAFRQLLSGRREQEDRAMRLLEPHGLTAIQKLEAFRSAHPELPDGARMRLRQAQYFLLLRELSKNEAEELARRLAFGNRDQKLAALTRLKDFGERTLPIIEDFVSHSDTLIRETAVDVMLYTGTRKALETIQDQLAQESDTNVLHAAIRQMADIPVNASREMLTQLVKHPDEDIVIESLAALESLSYATPEIVLPALRDPRWRVRVAALACIDSDGNLSAYREPLVTMLEDEDEFVQAAAVDAVVIAYGRNRTRSGRLSRSSNDQDEDLKRVQEELRALFDKDPAFTAPVIKAWLSWNQPLPEAMKATLSERSPDAIMPLFESLRSSGNHTREVVRLLSEHSSLDVQTGAYRLLAEPSNDREIRLLTNVILNGPDAKRRAVLQSLQVPLDNSQKAQGIASLDQVTVSTVTEKTSLDPLYDGFLLPLEALSSASPPAGNEKDSKDLFQLTEAQFKLKEALQQHYDATEDAEEKFQCLRQLLALGHRPAVSAASRELTKRPVSERLAIARAIDGKLHSAHLELLGQLLRDPAPEVRRAAGKLCLDTAKPATIQLLFGEFRRSGTLLQPHEIYSYSLRKSVQQRDTSKVIFAWVREVLAVTDEQDGKTVLALLLSAMAPAFPEETVVGFLKSPNQWVRRASLFALAQQRPEIFHQRFASVATDMSAKVRAAAAHALIDLRNYWKHSFNDVHELYGVSLSSSSSGLTRPRIPRGAVGVLRLLTKDPIAEVRFEAALALLQLSQPVDLNTLIAAFRELPEDANAGRRIADFLTKNLLRLGPEFEPLLGLLGKNDLNARQRQQIEARLRKDGETILTFNDLVNQTVPISSGPPAEIRLEASEDPATDSTSQARSEPFEVYYFHSPGCPDCARVRNHLEQLNQDFPTMRIVEKNIRLPENTVLNRALCLRFGVPSQLQNVTPSIFTEAGYVIRDEAKVFHHVEGLVQRTSAMPPTPDWAVLSATETATATRAVEAHFQSLTLGVVLAAGLLDGINPCAFATIIFFLSYLQVARRSPREILMVGGAFILAVFLTYLLIGLALNEVIGKIAEFQWARTGLNLIFALFAFLVMVLSFRDYARARRGELKDMTLQLPDALKNRIRGVIRTSARSSHFVIAAFVSGIVISLLELACTGQVYAPIIYAIQQGSKSAIALLISYNLAFILPLVVIFILAYGGLKSDALIRFQKKHTAGVKFAMGALFLILFLVLVGTAFG